MSNLLETMEKLGNGSLNIEDNQELVNELTSQLETMELPHIKSILIVPAEDDENEEQSDENQTDNKLVNY